MLVAMLGLWDFAYKRLPTNDATSIKKCKYLIYGQNFFDSRRSERYSEGLNVV